MFPPPPVPTQSKSPIIPPRPQRNLPPPPPIQNKHKGSNLDDLAVDANGGISVRAYALGNQERNFISQPPPVQIQEEQKEDIEEDTDEEDEFLKSKSYSYNGNDSEDKEDEESIKTARKSLANKKSKEHGIR